MVVSLDFVIHPICLLGLAFCIYSLGLKHECLQAFIHRLKHHPNFWKEIVLQKWEGAVKLVSLLHSWENSMKWSRGSWHIWNPLFEIHFLKITFWNSLFVIHFLKFTFCNSLFEIHFLIFIFWNLFFEIYCFEIYCFEIHF